MYKNGRFFYRSRKKKKYWYHYSPYDYKSKPSLGIYHKRGKYRNLEYGSAWYDDEHYVLSRRPHIATLGFDDSTGHDYIDVKFL